MLLVAPEMQHPGNKTQNSHNKRNMFAQKLNLPYSGIERTYPNASTYSHMRPYAIICSHMQPYAAICSHAPIPTDMGDITAGVHSASEVKQSRANVGLEMRIVGFALYLKGNAQFPTLTPRASSCNSTHLAVISHLWL